MRGKEIIWNLVFKGLVGRELLLGFCSSWPECLRGRKMPQQTTGLTSTTSSLPLPREARPVPVTHTSQKE